MAMFYLIQNKQMPLQSSILMWKYNGQMTDCHDITWRSALYINKFEAVNQILDTEDLVAFGDHI